MSYNPNERRASWRDRSSYSTHVIQAAEAIINIIHPEQREWSGWNGISNPDHGNMYNSLVAPDRMNPITFLQGLIDQAGKGGPNLWKRTKDSIHDTGFTWDGKRHEVVLTSNVGGFHRYEPVLGYILNKIEKQQSGRGKD